MTRVLFLLALVLTWGAVLHGLTMAVAGSFRRRPGERRPTGAADEQLPVVSLLVPAHDEEQVIEKSLREYLALDYPPDRLQVIVIDDASTDATGAICDRVAAEDDRLEVVHVPELEGGRGKAAALNRALPRCRGELIAVYDADNRPRRAALRRLVAECRDGRHVAAVGRIVKVNSRRNLLTRLSSLDFVTFQWTFQAGRARLFDLVLLTGTNYVVRADVLRSLGAWDPDALTEDLELSVRLYCAGHRTVFVPEAVAEEQDPDRLRAWIRQRTRWLLGTYYVLFKRTGAIVRSGQVRAFALLWEMFLLYCAFLVGIVLSQFFFYAGLAGFWHFHVGGPLAVLWLLAVVGFVLITQLAAALESDDTWRTPFLALVMYLFYSPLWLLVFFRALFLYVVRRGSVQWVRTPHTSS